jgi:hypothetical protein
MKLCFITPVWERGKAGASTVLSRILLRCEFLQVVREMCAASWRDRLYSERWALECLHQVYRGAVEFLAHAPRDAQKVLPPVLDDLIIALRSACSQPDLEFVGLVTVHRVQAQRRTLRALVTLQGSLSFLGYRDQRFPLSCLTWLLSSPGPS